MSDVQAAPQPVKEVSDRSATAKDSGEGWNGGAAREIWGKPAIPGQIGDSTQAAQQNNAEKDNQSGPSDTASSAQALKPASSADGSALATGPKEATTNANDQTRASNANDQSQPTLNPKDQANQQIDSANSANDLSRPAQQQAQAEGRQLPPEFPQMTIVNAQEEGPHKRQFQLGVAENVIKQNPAPQVADNQGPVNQELRAFCAQPIPSLAPPDGLAEAQKDLQNGKGSTADQIVLGAEIGVVKSVYGLGNGLISLGNDVLSPPMRLGNFLATTITNPQLSMTDASSWGTDTGKALVTGTRVVLAVDSYLDAVSRAEWKGDFGKVPRDAIGLAGQAANAFDKLPAGQKAEGVTEAVVSLGTPLAAGKAIGFVAEMQAKMASFLEKADAALDRLRLGPPGSGTGGELSPVLNSAADGTSALDATSKKEASEQALKMAGAASGTSLPMAERLSAITGKSAQEMEQRLAEMKAADPSGNRLLEINAIVKACENTTNFKPSADLLFSSISNEQLGAYGKLVQDMASIRNIDGINVKQMKNLEQEVTTTLRDMERAVKSGDPKAIDAAVDEIKDKNEWLRMANEGEEPGMEKPRRELPQGIHIYTLEQLKDEFAATPQRERLFQGLVKVLEELKAAGCKRVYLGGSFCSGKIKPGDFDLTWDPEGVDMSKLDPKLTGPTWATNRERKGQYGGDIFIRDPAVTGHDHVEEWQFDARSNVKKGVMQLNLEDMTL